MNIFISSTERMMWNEKDLLRYNRVRYCYQQYKELAKFYEVQLEILEGENERLKHIIGKQASGEYD